MISYLGYLKSSIYLLYFFISCSSQLSAQQFLGKDTLVCSSQYITLDAGPNGPYLWSTGETTSAIRVYQDGDYIVNAGGAIDTVKVTIYNGSYNQASKWTFGNGGSIQFDTSQVSNHKASNNPLVSSFSIPAGSATAVSDDGDLLFFTDGESIFDRTGKVIESGLAGDKNIGQNSLIIPKPGSAVEYYIFTMKDHKLSYSTAKIDANNNLSILKKNVLLAEGVDNKFGGVLNADNTGFWIMSHKLNSNTFQAFLLTKNGIDTPVVSNSGSTTTDSPGYLKFSPDGTRLAIASDFTEVFYFNNATGKVAFPKHLFFKSSYGLEFSANSSYLYVSSTTSTKIDSAGPVKPGGSLVRVNISYGYQTDVIASGTPATTYGALQLAPDEKIYVVKGNNNQSCLGTVNYPSKEDLQNYYSENALCISGSTTMGLPNFPQHYFTKSSNFFYYPTSPCEGDSMQIFAASRLIHLPYAKFSLKYTFDHPESGSADTSRELTPKHFYPGKEVVHRVTAYTKDVCKADTIRSNSFVFPRPVLAMTDTVVCPGDPLLEIDGGNKYASVGTEYLWILGKDTLGKKQLFTPQVSGVYRVEASIGNQCDTFDYFKVTYKTFPPFDLGPTKNVCTGDSTIFTSPIENPSSTFVWSTNELTKSIVIKSPGKYWLRVQDEGCSISDTVNVTYFPKPVDPSFKIDSNACFSSTVVLDAQNPTNFNYKWSTGENTKSIQVTKAGTYEVTIYNLGCSENFMSQINFLPPVDFPNNNPISICQKDNQTIEMDGGSGTEWIWTPGNENSRKIIVNRPGTYALIKKDSATGCIGNAEYKVYSICNPNIYFPTAFTPNEDGGNDVFKPFAKNLVSYELNIYNRWGELIYSSDNTESGWDGTFKGTPSPVDNYVYTVNYEGEGIDETKKYTLKGTLILLR